MNSPPNYKGDQCSAIPGKLANCSRAMLSNRGSETRFLNPKRTVHLILMLASSSRTLRTNAYWTYFCILKSFIRIFVCIAHTYIKCRGNAHQGDIWSAYQKEYQYGEFGHTTISLQNFGFNFRNSRYILLLLLLLLPLKLKELDIIIIMYH